MSILNIMIFRNRRFSLSHNGPRICDAGEFEPECFCEPKYITKPESLKLDEKPRFCKCAVMGRALSTAKLSSEYQLCYLEGLLCEQNIVRFHPKCSNSGSHFVGLFQFEKPVVQVNFQFSIDNHS